jgi:hypothetical protein
MRIRAGVDELCHYSDSVTRALNAPFQHMGYPELLSNFAQVPWIAAFVEHYRSAADDF